MKYLKFLAIIIIATGVSFTLLFENWSMKITGTALCVLGTAMLIAYYRTLLNNRKEEYETSLYNLDNNKENKIIQLNKEIADLKGQLEQKDQEIISLKSQPQSHPATPPDLNGELPLEERIQILRSYFEKDENLIDENKDLNADYRQFFAELKRAAIYQALFKSINDNYTTPMLKEIEPQEFELGDDSSQVLLGKLVQLALVNIDFTQEFHTQGNNGYDSLAIKMAAGIISHDEAIENAKRIILDVKKTKKTIRILYELVQKLGLYDKALIVNDTLLQE